MQLTEHLPQAPHVVMIQETSWKESMEFVTKAATASAEHQSWNAIHCGTGTSTKVGGLLTLVRADVCPAANLQSAELLKGRLLHVRIPLDTPVDLLNVYQHAEKSGLDPKARANLLEQRARLLDKITAWQRHQPKHHQLCIGGDFNCDLRTQHPFVGSGVPHALSRNKHDQPQFQAWVEANQLCACNTWSRNGAQARTFLLPKEGGSQIDFIFVRLSQIQPKMRTTRRLPSLPFVPDTGCRHMPLLVHLVERPKPPKLRPKPRDTIRVVKSALAKQDVKQNFRNSVQASLQAKLQTSSSMITPDLNETLSLAWMDAKPRKSNPSTGCEAVSRSPMLQRILRLWRLRKALRNINANTLTGNNTLAYTLHAWRCVAKLQKENREHRREQRERKRNRLQSAIDQHGMYQAAKMFCPKQPKSRLHKDPHGYIQTPCQIRAQIWSFYRELYNGPDPMPRYLSKPYVFTALEVHMAMCKLQAGKALPSGMSVAPLWKTAADIIEPYLLQEFQVAFPSGRIQIPDTWSIIPKPSKSMRTPADIRPICLLSLHAKLLAVMLADRIRGHAVAYLEGLPQFAYMPNKQVADALDRVFAHCSRGRQLTSGRWGSVHYRREGLCEPDAQGAFQMIFISVGFFTTLMSLN